MGFTLGLGRPTEDGSGILDIGSNVPLTPERTQQWLGFLTEFEALDPTVALDTTENRVDYDFDALGVLLSLRQEQAWIEGPWGRKADEQERWTAIGEMISEVQRRTGWVLFNDQTDRIETVDEMLAGSGVFPELLPRPAPEPQKRKLFRRRR